MLDWIIEVLVDLINLIFDVVVSVLQFVFDLICELVYQIAILLLDFLPDMNLCGWFDSDDIAKLKEVVYVWNSFLPVEEVFDITFIFLGIVISYSVFRFIIKLIPTIG